MDQFYDGNLQTSITTPATRATPSPTTRVPTAAAPEQMPACWTPAAPSWSGILLSIAAPNSKENLANTRSALISMKVCLQGSTYNNTHFLSPNPQVCQNWGLGEGG